MASSARKPYLRLKRSLVDFFRAPIVYIKQMNQRFSELEKPYFEDEYQQMHLSWPTWVWRGWRRRRFPRGPFDPSYAKMPQTGPFRMGKMDCVLHCWHVADCDDWVECFLMAWGGDKPAGAWKVTGDVSGVEVIYGTTTDIRFKLDSSMNTPRATVMFTDADGGVCSERVEAECATCSSTATIGYTTLGMQVDEGQTLEAQTGGTLDDDTGYTWQISSGDGSLSPRKGNSVIYTAPSSNAECAKNPTIDLLCDGVVIDSITIAINAVTAADPATTVVGTCILGNSCDYTPNTCVAWCAGGSTWCACIPKYKCDGTYITGSEECCRGFSEAQCIGGCQPGLIDDVRTAQMITDGCCPENAL